MVSTPLLVSKQHGSTLIKVLLSILENDRVPEHARRKALRGLMNFTWTQVGIPRPTDAQVDDAWRDMSNLHETLSVRCRGGSKTFDKTFTFLLNCIIRVYDAAWLAGTSHQLNRFSTYVSRFKARTWMGEYFTLTSKDNIPIISFLNSSEAIYTIHGTSGPRAALQYYDEEGKIRKIDIKRSNEEASGMKFGARGRIRIRHFTTLGRDTPVDAVYDRLEPLGMVFKMHHHECPWIDQAEIEHEKTVHPRWYWNLEYGCERDAPGGLIIKQFNVVTTVPEGGIITGGIDWNPSWGNALVVQRMSTNTGSTVIAELRSLDLVECAKFIAWHEQYWDCRWTAESQGGKTMNRSPQIRAIRLHARTDAPPLSYKDLMTDQEYTESGSSIRSTAFYPRIAQEEDWDPETQLRRIAHLEAESTRGRISVLACCILTRAHFSKWHYDEEDPDGLPAKGQEDHMCDAYAHCVKSLRRIMFR